MCGWILEARWGSRNAMVGFRIRNVKVDVVDENCQKFSVSSGGDGHPVTVEKPTADVGPDVR
jgi:hypothetical protein